MTWKLVNANAAALKVWGKTLSEVVGKTTDEIFPGSNASKHFKPIVERIFRENKPYQWESYFAGTDQTLLMKSIPIGALFVSTGIDITELKQFQSRLENANLRLIESVKAGQVGIWDWNILDDILIWDDLMFDIYGIKKGENISYAVWKHSLHPEDSETAQKAIDDAVKGNKEYELEFRIIQPSGEIRHISGAGTVIRHEDGTAVRMLGTNIDITERVVLQKNLLQAQKMDSLGSLAGGIAHDFNNQLAGISGFAELIKLNTHEPKIRDYAEKILTSLNHSKSLTSKLLSFSRQTNTTFKQVNVEHLVEETVSVLEHTLHKKINLSKCLNAKVAECLGDQAAIQNALLNLGLNARDAMPDGGDLVFMTDNINVHASDHYCQTEKIKPGRYIKVSVKDSGIGMDAFTLQRIFEPFFTTKELGRGTGMGLASVYGCVKEHHGFITAESEVNRGTTITFFLPCNESRVHATTKTTNEKHDNTDPTLTILLVDDEKDIREVGEEYLKASGHTVFCAEDGQEAITVFKAHSATIDLLILDINMPNMTGVECFTSIKKIKPEIQAIFCTGYAEATELENLKSHNIEHVLNKPYSFSSLSKAISQIQNTQPRNRV
ncbi:response regulator [Alteromonas sediminis]|uniref:histidine kinase n=1 Tax=Alteromonas sediminis TaxID=2259342 RepID=A0A3N5Z544_9ALTE|nr:response regulator [Alteromonas sediminis]RPJ65344.1 response regulator [Alteromonas sediminis]